VTPTASESAARLLDETDPVASMREQFRIPPNPSGSGASEAAYLAGNSLGLQPRSTRQEIEAELDDWAQFGVGGHEKAVRPWVSYHENLREPSARLVGARPEEVVAMNSLTVNLHLMMVSFYKPTPERHCILIEDGAFPSDSYAVRSQARFHGYEPDEAIIRIGPRPGEDVLRHEDIVDLLAREGHRVALVMLGAVNYYSGELLDIAAITKAGHAAGAVVGWDLAHAVGNVPLAMHDWDVDWAAWCTYKYLNSGPGAVAGAFVHSSHLDDESLDKFSGWWSTDPKTRFEMGPVVDPVHTADSWQLSNPPILAMAPVVASLRLFDAVGMDAVRARSLRLTAYLEVLLDTLLADFPTEVITPTEPARRGAQLSVRIVGKDAGSVATRLRDEWGVFADSRQPDVIRFAPAPLYNSYHDCWRAAHALASVLELDAKES
jgi:kynureninase